MTSDQLMHSARRVAMCGGPLRHLIIHVIGPVIGLHQQAVVRHDVIDHQSGLFQLVKDIDMLRLRHNVSALAKMSRLAKLPTFTMASVPDGPNGPLIPEIHRYNPEAIHIPRTGQINTWDNPKWVEAIQKTASAKYLVFMVKTKAHRS